MARKILDSRISLKRGEKKPLFLSSSRRLAEEGLDGQEDFERCIFEE
jgi:hypothetical protein